ncbi:MAG: hypothetical protein KC478_03185 [Bacteriovoracaceae bacterium]|nr:hypothetical protein [Bacteriovoracaceae bacterium]
MNKLLLSLLGASVALNFYLVKVDVVVKDDLDQEYVEPTPVDQISVAQASLQRESAKSCPPCEKKAELSKVTARECEEEQTALVPKFDKQDFEKKIAEVRESFEKDTIRFFEYELGLTSAQVNNYKNLQVERDAAIANYIDGRVDSNGGFMPSPEQMVDLAQIDKKYIQKLKSAFGESAYEDYIKYRDNFNRRLREQDQFHYSIQF